MAIKLGQCDPKSFLNAYTQIVFAPTIADVDAVVAIVDPSGLTVGTALTILTPVLGFHLRHARFVTLTCDDDDGGGGLSVTVQVVGTRWGNPVTDTITCTSVTGTLITTSGTVMFDQILSVTPRVITSADSGDAISVGLSGVAFGLERPISKITDVVSICNTASDVEATPLAPSSTTVNVAQSAIIGISMAVTDRWEVKFFSNGPDGVGNGGVYA